MNGIKYQWNQLDRIHEFCRENGDLGWGIDYCEVEDCFSVWVSGHPKQRDQYIKRCYDFKFAADSITSNECLVNRGEK